MDENINSFHNADCCEYNEIEHVLAGHKVKKDAIWKEVLHLFLKYVFNMCHFQEHIYHIIAEFTVQCMFNELLVQCYTSGQ
jgi:hypothetical protein